MSRLPGGYAFGGTGPMGEVVGERNGRDTGVERGCTGAHQTKDANRFTLIRSRLKKLGVILMKLYFEAEKYLSAKGGGLNTQIFNNKHLSSSPKHIYALVYSTMRYKPYLEEVIKKSKIRQSSKLKKLKVSDSLLLLLVHDLLFSPRGRIELGKHPIKDAVLENKTRLQAELIKLKLRYKVKTLADLPNTVEQDETPIRWIRINTIVASEEEVMREDFFEKLKFVDSTDEIASGKIYRDTIVTNLYGIHPSEKITNTEAYKNGKIIIQDRASCFPAQILNGDPENQHEVVIDACAAPGNKTTHLASFLPKNGVVHAFERDDKRVKTLKMMTSKALGPNKDLIQITHADFMTIVPSDFPKGTGIVVDPSCSGSGIFGRALEDAQLEQDRETIDTERLTKLASFQFKIVKHTMKFPGARKIVYSTCSIHPHENERVVMDLLADPEVKEQGWKLAPKEQVLPNWHRRGWKDEFVSMSRDPQVCEQLAGGCVRAVPKEDGGIGFFAACFIR